MARTGILRTRGVVGVAIAIATGLVAITTGQTPEPAPDVVTLDVSRPGPAISPGMFGLFFEDINFAADGGLYPERVKNRSFEFTEPLAGWGKAWRPAADGELIIRTDGALSQNNPHYLRWRVYTPDVGPGLVNSGFRGIGVEADAEYVFSIYARAHSGGPQKLTARILAGQGQPPLAQATLAGFTGQWTRYEATLRPSATNPKAQLEITADGVGELDLDLISLYPRQTWKNRPNGLRPDLVQLLADMTPGFLRFPGGCIVEGRRLHLRYDWKNTVGEVGERKPLINRWNDEFSHRLAPDYFQSFGLGFYEYFQLAEDIGASPLPIVNCGMACQFNSGETAGLDELDPYIQDALDLVAFANGPLDTRWGQLRARMGHPSPFNLRMIGIGNEQFGPRYIERYKRFADALKKAHPEIALVSSAGPFPAGKDFDYTWTNLRRLRTDIVDEHYYMPPAWFLGNAHRYDSYDRTGPKVYAGEYAAQTAGMARPDNRNNWEGALAEAAYMTGLERNADVVAMASYAPLFAHVDAWQWTPNLIWFDNLRSYGTPNYYVQKMYATNQGTHVLRVDMNGSESNAQGGLYVSASIDQKSGQVILKAVNTNATSRRMRVDLKRTGPVRGNARLVVLASPDLKTENDLERPLRFAPAERTVAVSSGGFELTLDPQSFTVLRAGYTR